MRIPGFSAEASLYRHERNYRGAAAAPSGALGGAGFAPAQMIGNRLGGGIGGINDGPLSYVCTPDGKACACSGAGDCLSCAMNPAACGGMSCMCSPTACGCN